jgi:hypothetical protein
LAADAAAFSGRGASNVATLASPGGNIEWFAQSGGRVAWLGSRRSKAHPGSSDVCWNTEHGSSGDLALHLNVRDLSTAKERVVTLRNPCQYSAMGEPALALGGTHVVSEFIDGVGNTEIDVSVEAADVRSGKRWKATNASALELDANSEQHVPLLVAADGSLLAAYSDCDLGEECLSPGGSGVHRVRPVDDVNIDWGLPKLFEVSDLPELLAVGGRTVAVVSQREILIGSTRLGRVTARMKTSGAHRALATSGRILAILTSRRGVDWIDLYDARTGDSRGKVDVGRAGDGLAVSGFRVVFSSGRFIRALDARTRKTSVVAVAAATPIGLSVDGRRVAWAENAPGGARISAVLLARP